MFSESTASNALFGWLWTPFGKANFPAAHIAVERHKRKGLRAGRIARIVSVEKRHLRVQIHQALRNRLAIGS
jgi:hypothetical protein